MGIFYIIPVCLMWAAWGAIAYFSQPNFFVDYVLFGGACAVTGVALIILSFMSAWRG